jgi:hypothetical protein
MVKITYRLLSLTILVLFLSCKRERNKAAKPKESSIVGQTVHSIEKKQVIASTEIKNINFYFENSGSINGYLSGTNFLKTMHYIIDDSDERLIPYFVNSKEYKTKNILSKIDEKRIKTVGTSSSDHKFIFTNAIKSAIGNNLSVVVTDGIYSTPNGNIGVVEVEIEKAFKRALKVNEIETVVIKMASKYSGMYYTGSGCVNIKINQERPYYIILFGSKKMINRGLEDIGKLDGLPGFEEQARFLLTKNFNAGYSILTYSEDIKGSFKPTVRDSSLVKDIEDAERFSKGGEQYLQIPIAVDYSGTSLPFSYVEDIENYSVTGGTGYEIVEIKPITSVNASSHTYQNVKKINKDSNIQLSHIIIIKAKLKATGSLSIVLENNMPSWIKATGQENDCEIKGNTTQTYAFDRLISGISKAYIAINQNKHYLKMNFNIKH